MKNKRIIIIVFVTILIALLIVVLYPQLGKNAIEKSTYDFLYKDGYVESEISSVEVRHSYINGLLGYGQWHTSIYFADEPKVEYHCILGNGIIPKVTAITAAGFSTDLPENYEPLHYPG